MLTKIVHMFVQRGMYKNTYTIYMHAYLDLDLSNYNTE